MGRVSRFGHLKIGRESDDLFATQNERQQGDVIMEDSIATETVQIERKQFFFDLRENQRGILLRITEEVRGHRDTIIIPATGLKDFSDALNKMMDVIDQEGLDPTDPTSDEDDFYDDDIPQADEADEEDDQDDPEDDPEDDY
ncbi:MAG: PUR family DNA/RNA-binding protein [Kiritimatiellia bacterium]